MKRSYGLGCLYPRHVLYGKYVWTMPWLRQLISVFAKSIQWYTWQEYYIQSMVIHYSINIKYTQHTSGWVYQAVCITHIKFILILYSCTATSRVRYLKKRKEDLPADAMIVLCDFAENYTFAVQDEIQGYHWASHNVHCTLLCYIKIMLKWVTR